MINDKHRGFTLIELLITITVVTIGITGAFIAIQQGISAIGYANSRFVAAFLAQEGVEIIKSIRDTNLLEYNYISTSTPWNEGLSPSPSPAADFEIEYVNPHSLDPILTEPGCSPVCDFDGLRFLKKTKHGFYNYSSLGEDTQFKRRIHIEEVAVDHLKVDITVYWKKRGGGNHELTLRQHLYDWW